MITNYELKLLSSDIIIVTVLSLTAKTFFQVKYMQIRNKIND